MTCGIYKITNKINNKCYIGQSINVENRIEGHIKDLINNKHKNKHLQSSFNKYGFINFSFEIIKECNECELDKIEEKLIINSKSYLPENGYNHLIGNFYNSKKISSEDINDIINTFIEDANTDINDIIKKYNISRSYVYGLLKQNNIKRKKTNSIETRKKISKSLKGKKLSDQHYKNVTLANKKSHGNTKTTEKQIKEIINLLLQNKTNKEIQNITGCSYSIISNVRNKKGWDNLLNGIEFPKIKEKQLAINEDQAIEIINLLLNGKSMRSIANIYGVSLTVIRNIKIKKTWKHLTEDINF